MPILGVAGDIQPRKRKKHDRGSHVRKHAHKPKESREDRLARRAALRAKRRAKKLALLAEVRLQPGWSSENHGRLRNFQLYVLELEDGCYYVGMTAYRDANVRFRQHLSGKGAKWTKLHKPIRILETRPIGECWESAAARQENDLTIEYMLRYGTKLVRGGDMCFLSHEKVDLKFRGRIRRQMEIMKPAEIS